MKRRVIIREEDYPKIEEEYLNNKRSVGDLALEYGVGKNTLKKILKGIGVKLRKGGEEGWRKRRLNSLPDESILRDIEESYLEGKSIKNLTIEHKMCSQNIRGILKRRGVRIRDIGEGKRITPPPREKLQESYKRLGNQSKVADEFGVSQRMISMWMIKYDLPRKSNRGCGSNNPNWKGGIKKCNGGRIKKKSKNHPRADSGGYVFNHILVWEKAHGAIPPGYVIHHINGIKDDDRIENLALLERSKHHLYLVLEDTKEKRIKELERENMELRKMINNVR